MPNDLSPGEEWLYCAYGTLDPAIADLPNVLTRFSSEIVRLIVNLTQSKPGYWPLPPPFDENGRNTFEETGEHISLERFHLWATPQNQEAAIWGMSAVETVMVDTVVANTRLKELLGVAFPSDVAESPGLLWKTVASAISELRWAAVPVTPDADWLVFVTSPECSRWVSGVEAWCRLHQVACSKLERRDGKVIETEIIKG